MKFKELRKREMMLRKKREGAASRDGKQREADLEDPLRDNNFKGGEG